jgi:DNA protecting protein DprA
MISSRSEALAWFTLANIRGIGAKKLWLLADFLSSEHKDAHWLVERMQAHELPRELESRLALGDWNSKDIDCYTEFESLEARRISILHPLHSDFPKKLDRFRSDQNLPGLLYVEGPTSLLRQRSVAIVGSRDADDQVLRATGELAQKLADKGINVISGYARGVDFAAHLASLKGGGTTTAVLSEGLAGFAHKKEIRQYINQFNTAVVSQFTPRARWAAHNAMARNKLVIALADAIVVMTSGPERDENNRMSGTFDAGISAQHMGVPTFVVSPSWFPVPPAGNKDLIRRGCNEWNPTSGPNQIISAMSQGPLTLFD